MAPIFLIVIVVAILTVIVGERLYAAFLKTGRAKALAKELSTQIPDDDDHLRPHSMDARNPFSES
jgi:hypothetical protein